LGVQALAFPGECKEGIKLCEEALKLFRKSGDKAGISRALNSIGELARLDSDYERAGRAYQDAIDIARKRGDKLAEAISSANLGYVAHHQGNYEQAEAILAKSLTRFLEIENTRYIPQALAVFAGPVAAQGHPAKAARLLGASEALLESMGIDLQAGDQFEVERYVAAVREQLDEATFDAAWTDGRAMSLGQAVSYALEVGQLTPDSSR
jgi:non-specific serine/threonine protein kinase